MDKKYKLMEILKSTCENKACKGHGFSYVEYNTCPFCSDALTPCFETIQTEVYQKVMQLYPAHIAAPVFNLQTSTSHYKRLHYISDALIGGLRLSGNLLIAKYKKASETSDEIEEALEQIAKHETHGAWSEVITKLYTFLNADENIHFLEQYIPLLGKSSKNFKKEKLFSVENKFTDEYGKVQKVKSEGTPLQLLINFRNRYLGHGAVISEEESKLIYETYNPIFSQFLTHLSFLTHYSWKVGAENLIGWNCKLNEIKELTVANATEHYNLDTNFPIQYEAINSSIYGNYHCQTSNCIFEQNHIGLSVQQYCPSCQNPMQLATEELMDEKDMLIINEYPYVLAYPFQRALIEQEPYKKIHLLKETFLNYLKYLGLLVASEYFKSDIKNKQLNSNFRELLFRPQFGYWNKYIREGVQLLEENKHQWFVTELPEYYKQIEMDKYQQTEIASTSIGQLIQFRNKYLGHGMVPSDSDCRNLWNTYFPILKDLLLKMDFARNYAMVSFDNLRMWRLMGIEFTPLQNVKKTNTEDRVQLVNRKDERMNLVPFFVLPGEFFRQETSSRAKLMVYEQNTGKRIIFFSPESITDESSGKVLDNLNQMLSNKEKEKSYNEKTFIHQSFSDALRYRNSEIKRSLINERKVIEGVYQAREEAEIELRSWVGARAGLFFISADAGSGKTNLLFEMVNQYQERSIPTLLIRANRMAKSDIWEELKYQLNLTDDFDIKKSSVFTQFSQENPFIILIDAGNEHPDPNKLLTSILDFLKENNGGHIKIVLTWRVTSKSSLPQVEYHYEQIIYSSGESEEREANLLAKKCSWLKPLNKKELEGAWNFYTTIQAKTHKPQFSFEDLTYHDRALTDQLQNPLMLRLFLELFHNKQLPKKKGFINIWRLYHNKVIQD
jgi:hypothetical protein